MSRQSITFTKPNDEWLKTQVDSQEYSSKSEVINDLIRQARKQHIELWTGLGQNWTKPKKAVLQTTPKQI